MVAAFLVGSVCSEDSHLHLQLHWNTNAPRTTPRESENYWTLLPECRAGWCITTSAAREQPRDHRDHAIPETSTCLAWNHARHAAFQPDSHPKHRHETISCTRGNAKADTRESHRPTNSSMARRHVLLAEDESPPTELLFLAYAWQRGLLGFPHWIRHLPIEIGPFPALEDRRLTLMTVLDNHPRSVQKAAPRHHEHGSHLLQLASRISPQVRTANKPLAAPAKTRHSRCDHRLHTPAS